MLPDKMYKILLKIKEIHDLMNVLDDLYMHNYIEENDHSRLINDSVSLLRHYINRSGSYR